MMFSALGLAAPAADNNGTGQPGDKVHVAIVGNPNSGKTTLFNALTGLKQKVGNYPGVTVEKKEGEYQYNQRRYRLVDLPGTYSLKAASEDERVVRDVLLHLLDQDSVVDLVLVVIDATHLERNLYLASQILDLGLPTVIALTMNDEARRGGVAVDSALLAKRLGVSVVEVVVPQGAGLVELRRTLEADLGRVPQPPPWRVGERVLSAVDRLSAKIAEHHPQSQGFLREEALDILTAPGDDHPLLALPGVSELTAELRSELEDTGLKWRRAEAEGRYGWVQEVTAADKESAAGRPAENYKANRHDFVDRILTQPVLGLVLFAVLMAVVFQAIFSWAVPFMDAIDWAVGNSGLWVAERIPGTGMFESLLVDGIIGGVGGVLIFLPQILILFFFIAVLEDSGYMARAAYLMNRHMRRAGLHGKAFIPLLSGFACSIPGIMAARTISDKRDRLVTILVAPFISCGARLPVYALMIAAFVPATRLVPGFSLQGLVLLCAYLFSIAAAITAAFILRKTMFRGEAQPFILELPPYRFPYWRTVLSTMLERGKVFLVQAGTIILAMNIILWFMLSFPQDKTATAAFDTRIAKLEATAATSASVSEQIAQLESEKNAALLQGSIAGRLGKVIEPVIKPLGFDWKIGIGLIGSIAAREVFVSTLAVVYGVSDDSDAQVGLIDRIKTEKAPDGSNVYNTIVGINIILFFILACQCMATLAVVKRETNSWKWPLFMFGYMTATAWIVCFIFYQVASRLWPGVLQ